ncbi:MAG TPA: VOC family protein [Thermoanaerobaculia bacterium]|jgi:uncharacterized glyoxalase superfamily protein PhnB|nr:VOC family protein [Thermoanaerobaculia bacterium]
MTTTSASTAPATASTTATVFPFLRYRDARAAIAWLTAALGFTEKAIHDAPDGSVGHAELRFGDGLVMLGSANDDAFGIRPPRELGGATTACSLVVTDLDAHHALACAAGAAIVQPLANTTYGARGYTCRDPEGNLWAVSTYAPAGGAGVNLDITYDDGRAAIAWLEKAFGMIPSLVVPGPGDLVAHAELRCGDGLVMLASYQDNAIGLATARRLGGTNGGAYVVVADPDAHAARARAAGATIVFDLKDTDYGSREYACRDLEGNLWSFGTYQP